MGIVRSRHLARRGEVEAPALCDAAGEILAANRADMETDQTLHSELVNPKVTISKRLVAEFSRYEWKAAREFKSLKVFRGQALRRK